MSEIVDRPPGPAAPSTSIAPRWVALDEIVETEAFRLRETDEVAALAESLVRHGQIEPVELRALPQGLQLLAGHRRVAAARMLGRRRVLARVHEALSERDALFLALVDDLDRRPWISLERAKLRERLTSLGPLPPKVEALLDRAEAEARSEGVDDAHLGEVDEVDADVMASSVRDRLADACNDLAALHEIWPDLDEGRRADLVQCVAYLKDMYPFLIVTENEDP